MPKEIIISVSGDQSRIAIVEDGELVELYVENPENVRTIGDIYLARIRRILPGIKAAFVDVGQKQDAFLHFSDLSDNVPALLELADGKVRERSAAELSKEPPAADALEPESAEEKLAASRRKELKRQPASRRRGAEKAADAEQPAAGKETAAAEEGQKQERGRRRRAPRQPDPAPASENGAPIAPAILPPESGEAESPAAEPADASVAPPEERARPKRRRGRRRKAGDEAAPVQEVPSDEKEDEQRKPSRRSRTPKPSEPKADPLVVKPGVAAPKAGGDAPGEDAPEVGTPPRLAPSSRFRIDLTAGSSDAGAPAPRREEEEEEEERTSSRRRRKSRSGGDRRRQKSSSKGGGRGRGNGGGKGNGRNKGDDDDDDDEKEGTVPMVADGKAPQDYLKQDQRIVVKIIKEPISTKGPRVSTDVSLAGRFLVLVPAADYVAVSKKIDSAKERRRLRALARSLLPEGLGLIVRTVAEGRDAKTLDADLQLLLDKWRKIEDQLRKRPDPPARLYEDVNMVSSIIRDLFSEDYDKIVIDDQTVYRNIKNYVQAVAPQMSDIVQLHKAKEPVFRTYKIERDIRAAFEQRVSLPGGGYLIIEHTEAMHVVDVNSGRAGRGLTQEQNALKVNLEAAQEIAKQLRLRDLGGIICVDFIDMRSDAYRKKLFDELKRAFRRDRAVTKMLPLSDFGVLEITRQRLRPSITTTLDVEVLGEAPPDEEEDVQPAAEAPSRRERSASDVVTHLERWLVNYREQVQEQHRKRAILLRVHPFTAAYLQRGIPSVFTRWRFKMRLKMNLEIDETIDPLAFQVRDEKSGKNLTRRFDPDR